MKRETLLLIQGLGEIVLFTFLAYIVFYQIRHAIRQVRNPDYQDAEITMQIIFVVVVLVLSLLFLVR
jgi:uncharacterized membrane protein YidH (DUF202 family)